MRKGFGIIGLGTWGMTHARGYASHPSARLIAVCDTVRDRAEAVAESCPKCNIYTDYSDILADERIHAVSIATPDHVREQVFCAAAEAGKHILVEKPLAISVDECERMIEAANASGIKVMVDFHNRWNPPFVQAKRSLTNGELGDLAAASIRLSNTTFVPTEMLGWSAQTTVAWFLGSHCIDLARWLFDDEVVAVSAVTHTGVLENLGRSTPDLFFYHLTFSHGGVATIENCWILSDRMPSPVEFKAELIGSKGTLCIDITHHRALEKYAPGGASYPDVFAFPATDTGSCGFAIASIHHFIDCVVADREPSPTIMDGLAATRIIQAVHRSAATGKPVKLSPTS